MPGNNWPIEEHLGINFIRYLGLNHLVIDVGIKNLLSFIKLSATCHQHILPLTWAEILHLAFITRGCNFKILLGIYYAERKTLKISLRKKCPYSELFWSAFSHIRTEYGEIRSISPYSVRMRENADQNNSDYGHFPCSIYFIHIFFILVSETNQMQK